MRGGLISDVNLLVRDKCWQLEGFVVIDEFIDMQSAVVLEAKSWPRSQRLIKTKVFGSECLLRRGMVKDQAVGFDTVSYCDGLD